MQDKIKCIVVDDEPIARRIIINHLSHFPGIDIIAECCNAIEVIEIINNKHIDLIFLDIQMPGITGIDFIKATPNSPRVIFTTAYRDYAITAFDLNVVDYLLKPISLDRFAKAINKFLNLHKLTETSVNENEYILLKADRKQYKVLLKDIRYFESMGDYVIVYIKDKKITVKERLSNLETSLPQSNFTRIHRGYIVSINNIDAIGSGFVEIVGQSLPVGRNYKENIEKLYKL